MEWLEQLALTVTQPTIAGAIRIAAAAIVMVIATVQVDTPCEKHVIITGVAGVAGLAIVYSAKTMAIARRRARA